MADTNPAKRALAHEGEVDGGAFKKQKGDGVGGDDGANLLELRVLIDSPEASIIIGRGGENVKNVRAQTGAFVSVLEQSTGAKQRIMTLKGLPEAVANASNMFVEFLLSAAVVRAQKAVPPREEPTTFTFRILIHKFMAGCIIGKAGAVIQQITTESGAKLHLDTETLGHSTEKLCAISGTPSQIHAAMRMVCTQLYQNPPKSSTGGVLYVPGALPPAPPHFPYPPAPGHPYGAPPPGTFARPPPQHTARAAPAPLPGVESLPDGRKVERIVIPTVCAGSIIGKAGSIIREIREQSRVAQLSIADPDPAAPNDRVVTITGSAESVANAIALIRHKIESYTPPPGTPAAFAPPPPRPAYPGYPPPPPAPAAYGGYEAPPQAQAYPGYGGYQPAAASQPASYQTSSYPSATASYPPAPGASAFLPQGQYPYGGGY